MDMRQDRMDDAWEDEQSRLRMESIVPDDKEYSQFIWDFQGSGGTAQIEWLRGEIEDALEVIELESGIELATVDVTIKTDDDWSFIPKHVCGCKDGIQWVAELSINKSIDTELVYFVWRRSEFIDMKHSEAKARMRVL